MRTRTRLHLATGVLLAAAAAQPLLAQDAEVADTTIAEFQNNAASIDASSGGSLELRFELPGGSASTGGTDSGGGGTGGGTTLDPVFTEVVFNNDTADILTFYTNAGSFGDALYQSDTTQDVLDYFAANPTGTTPADGIFLYEYAPVYVVPSVSGTYTIGQSSAPADTLLYFYEGEFDPSDFSTNFIGGNDDWNSGYGSVDTLPDGVTLTGCPFNRFLCPVTEITLEGGTAYTMVLSHYGESGAAAFDFPQTVFASGPGEVSIVGSLDEATQVLNGFRIVDSSLAVTGNTMSASPVGNTASNVLNLGRAQPDAGTVGFAGTSVTSGGATDVLIGRGDHAVLNAQRNTGQIDGRLDGAVSGQPAAVVITSPMTVVGSSALIDTNRLAVESRGNRSDTQLRMDGGLSETAALGVRQDNLGNIAALVPQGLAKVELLSMEQSTSRVTANVIASAAIANASSVEFARIGN